MTMKENLIGKRFGKLTVKREVERIHQFRRRLECVCDCGKTVIALAYNLRTGNTCSCGCLRRAMNVTHGHASNRSATPTYRSWQNMMKRCYDPKAVGYSNYGGRGIKVCDRWLNSFEAFLEDMGERPLGKSIDRINGNLDYQKENCKWSTSREQNSNRSNNRILSFNGQTKTVSDWARELNCRYTKLFHRLNRGWTVEKTITTP